VVVLVELSVVVGVAVAGVVVLVELSVVVGVAVAVLVGVTVAVVVVEQRHNKKVLIFARMKWNQRIPQFYKIFYIIPIQ
jgi:hypothetical protein